jgi:hypothetical protein
MGRFPARGALVIALIGAISLPALAAETQTASTRGSFRYTLRIGAANYLFVGGHEFHGEVVCTWAEGDTLRIEGIPALPERLPPAAASESGDSNEVYGDVPYVRRLVSEGSTWNEAVDKYNHQRDEVDKTIWRVYWGARRQSGSRDVAAKAALDSLDRSLIDPSVEPTAGKSGIRLKWMGLPWTGEIGFGDGPPPTDSSVATPKGVSEKMARGFVQQLSAELGMRGPLMVEVLGSGQIILSGAHVQEALSQIRAALNGEATSGPLGDRELKAIVDARRGGAR